MFSKLKIPFQDKLQYFDVNVDMWLRFYNLSLVAGNKLEQYNNGDGIIVPFEIVRKVH